MKHLILLLTLLTNFSILSQESLPSQFISMIGLVQNELTAKNAENIHIGNTLDIVNYTGTPVMLSKWSKAEVLLKDGKTYTIPYVNYDALDDVFLIYLKNYKPEYSQIASKKFPLVTLTPQNIVAIALSNDEDGTVRFVQVSPKRFANIPKTKFMEYFTIQPKDALILKSVYKKIKKNFMRDMAYTNSNEDFQFLTFYTYYIKNKNKLFISTHLGKKNILKAIGDPDAIKPLKKYIKAQHLKMSKPEDVQKLLEYYFKELN